MPLIYVDIFWHPVAIGRHGSVPSIVWYALLFEIRFVVQMDLSTPALAAALAPAPAAAPAGWGRPRQGRPQSAAPPARSALQTANVLSFP